MKFAEFIKSELKGWGKFERIFFPLEILFIIVLSFLINDSKIALVSAICGILYTIFAGKGKISCYAFGLSGTLCYSYLSFANRLWGNLALYLLFYLPMQILGIFKWKKHLKKSSQEIIKTRLSKKERIFYLLSATLISFILSLILKKMGDATPYIDGVTTIFSIFGMIFTVRRCIEQWYVWILVNGLSVVMWIEAYLKGSNCLATVIMWITYFLLAFYFLHNWKKETSLSIEFNKNDKINLY